MMTITADFLFRVDNNGLAEAEIKTIINNEPRFNVIDIKTIDAVKCDPTGDPDFDNDCDFYIRATFNADCDLKTATEILDNIPEYLEIVPSNQNKG